MKKRLSHFAYNERSRSSWTLTIPHFTPLSPIRSTIKTVTYVPGTFVTLVSGPHKRGIEGYLYISLSCALLHAPASTAVTALLNEADERMIIFSASTMRKNTNPARKSHGQTQSGIASLSNSACSGGA